MFNNKYRFFCDKLSNWRSFGVSYNWDDGYYFGIYIYKYLIGIQKPCIRKDWSFYKEAVVKTEDLRKDL